MPGIPKERVVEAFMEEMDEIACHMCKCIFISPVVAKCGHSFCESCIEPWLNQNEVCPVDEKPLKDKSLVPINDQRAEIVKTIRVKCDNYRSGCPEVLTMDQIDSHLPECQHKEADEEGVVFVDNQEKEVKRCNKQCRMWITKEDAIRYEFGVEFKIIQTLKSGRKRAAELVSEINKVFWIYTIIDERDIDIEIEVNNKDNKNNVRFELTVGNADISKRFVVEAGKVGVIKALEDNGPHLHVVGQDTEDGRLMLAQIVKRDGIQLKKAKVESALIRIGPIEVEKAIEDKPEKKYSQMAKVWDTRPSFSLPETMGTVICLGEETNQKFVEYPYPFTLGKKFKGFTFDLKRQTKRLP